MTGKDVLPEEDLVEKATALKNLNIYRYANNWKNKLVLQKNSIKIWTLILNIIKKWKSQNKKQKKLRFKSSLQYHTFYKYHNIEQFANCSVETNGNDLFEFKNKLESFYHNIIDTKPNNEYQIKNLKKKELFLIKALNHMISF